MAPVSQQPRGEKIAMTALVAQQRVREQWVATEHATNKNVRGPRAATAAIASHDIALLVMRMWKRERKGT